MVGNAGVFLNQGQKTTRLKCCLQFSLLAFYSCVSAAYFSVTLKKVLTLCISRYKSFSSSRKYKERGNEQKQKQSPQVWRRQKAAGGS